MKVTSINSYFKLAMGIIYNTKWRNFWTILGIIIGLSSVVTVISVGNGIKQQINGQLVSKANNYIVIEPKITNQTNHSSNSLINNFESLSLIGSLNNSDFPVAQQVKGVESVSPFGLIRTSVSNGKSVSRDSILVATNNYLPEFLNLPLATGQFIDQLNEPINSVVIGQSLAAKLFNDLSPLGSTIYISNQPYVIQGVLSKVNNLPLGQLVDFNNAVLIDYNNAQTLTANNVFLYQVFGKINPNQNQIAVKSLLQSNLNESNGNQANTRVTNISEMSDNSKSILSLLTKLIAIVAAISLLVGGIGVMNVMFVSVAERTHEIGIRKAIGATNKQIVSQFLIEAIILSFIGGVIGVILSYIIDLFIVLSTAIKPIITIQLIIISLIVSVLIGVVFGSIPAFKASRKIPIDSLRNS